MVFTRQNPAYRSVAREPATLRVTPWRVAAFRPFGCSSSISRRFSSLAFFHQPTFPVPPDSVHHRFLALVFFGVLAGCASAPSSARVPETPTTPREPDRPVTVSTPKGAPIFTYRDGSYSYDIVQTTTVSVGAVPDASRQDTLRTVGALTYSISGSSGLPVVTATIDSLVITSTRDSATPPRRLSVPVVLQLPLIEPPIATASDSAALMAKCDALEEAARGLASDIHVRIPVTVERGQTWSDSTSLAICRGGIPLTGTRVSRYQISEVRAVRDSTIAKVSRQTTLMISGTGTQGTRHISVRGQGTSDTIFTFDVTAGRFLESTGQSVLQLSFETIQQTDQIVQHSTSAVRLRALTPGR